MRRRRCGRVRCPLPADEHEYALSPARLYGIMGIWKEETFYAKKDVQMPIEDVVLEKVRRLRPEQQEEVLRFVEYLEFKQQPALERVIAQIRERSGSLDVAEMESLIEEAREEYYHSSHAA